MDLNTGKMVVYGMLLGCTQAVLCIAASMDQRSVFETKATSGLTAGGSDLYTTYNAYRRWRMETQGAGAR